MILSGRWKNRVGLGLEGDGISKGLFLCIPPFLLGQAALDGLFGFQAVKLLRSKLLHWAGWSVNSGLGGNISYAKETSSTS